MTDSEASRLLILGVSGRSAAQSAVRGGLRPLVLDAFADLDTARTCGTQRITDYPAGLVGASLRWSPRDWLYTGGLENHPQLVDDLAAFHRLLGNPGSVLRAVRDPWQTADVLRQAGFIVAELCSAESPPAEGEFLRKNCHSGGGLGIVEHAPGRGYFASPRPAHLAYFQQRIPGRSYSATFLANGHRAAFVGLTRQWTGCESWGATGFQYSGSRTVETLPCPAPRLSHLGHSLAEAFGLQGLFGVDLICCDGEPVVVEVNPRYTASCELLERQTGVSLIRAHVDVCRGGPLFESNLFHRRSTRHYGKAILYARERTHVTVEFVDRLLATAERQWPAWADITPPGTTVEAGHPILSLLAAASREQAVRERLEQRARATQRWLATDAQRPGA